MQLLADVDAQQKQPVLLVDVLPNRHGVLTTNGFEKNTSSYLGLTVAMWFNTLLIRSFSLFMFNDCYILLMHNVEV